MNIAWIFDNAYLGIVLLAYSSTVMRHYVIASNTPGARINVSQNLRGFLPAFVAFLHIPIFFWLPAFLVIQEGFAVGLGIWVALLVAMWLVSFLLGLVPFLVIHFWLAVIASIIGLLVTVPIATNPASSDNDTAARPSPNATVHLEKSPEYYDVNNNVYNCHPKVGQHVVTILFGWKSGGDEGFDYYNVKKHFSAADLDLIECTNFIDRIISVRDTKSEAIEDVDKAHAIAKSKGWLHVYLNVSRVTENGLKNEAYR